MEQRAGATVFVSHETFARLAAENDVARLERDAQGRLIVLPPAGNDSSERNADLVAQLYMWNARDKLGHVTGPDGGFTLPNGAVRAPDATWISSARRATTTPQDRKGFVHVCPEFAVELVSPSDRLSDVRAKGFEYIENGALLVWILDPKHRTVEIMRPGIDPEILHDPISVSADPELPGFTLDCGPIFDSPDTSRARR